MSISVFPFWLKIILIKSFNFTLISCCFNGKSISYSFEVFIQNREITTSISKFLFLQTFTRKQTLIHPKRPITERAGRSHWKIKRNDSASVPAHPQSCHNPNDVPGEAEKARVREGRCSGPHSPRDTPITEEVEEEEVLGRKQPHKQLKRRL